MPKLTRIHLNPVLTSALVKINPSFSKSKARPNITINVMKIPSPEKGPFWGCPS
jgi:hypothetical protein